MFPLELKHRGRVRTATPSDIPALASARTASWRDAYVGILPKAELNRVTWSRSAARLSKAIERHRRGHRLLLVESSRGSPVGYAWAGPASADLQPLRGEVYELYLTPAFQGAGLGRQLLTQSIWSLVDLGLNPVGLWVLADNPARNFYAACGGVPLAEGWIDVGDHRTRRVAYSWQDALPLPTLGAPSL